MRGEGGRERGVHSGIAREWADTKDLLSPTSPVGIGSGDTNSSETDDESRESDDERGGMVVP